MTRLEQIFDQERKAKFGIDHLETEPVGKPQCAVDDKKPAKPNTHEANRLAELKQKFGMSALHMDGLLGARLEQTLEDEMRRTAREQSSGYKLATACVNFQQSKLRLWVEVKK